MLAETQQLALDTQRLSLEEKRYKYKEALQKALSHLDVDSTDPDKEIKRAQVFANIKRQVRKLQEDTYLGMAIGEKPNLVVEWACAKLRKVDNTIDHSYADNNDLESFFLQIESRYAYAREDVAALEKLKKTRNIKTERDVSTACDEFKRLSKLVLSGMGPREILFRSFLSNWELEPLVHSALLRSLDQERLTFHDEFDVDKIANSAGRVAASLTHAAHGDKRGGGRSSKPRQQQYQRQQQPNDDVTSGKQRYPDLDDAEWKLRRSKVVAMPDNPGMDRVARNREAGRLGVCGVCGGNTHFTNRCAKRKTSN